MDKKKTSLRYSELSIKGLSYRFKCHGNVGQDEIKTADKINYNVITR